MHPILFDFGDFKIYSFGVMIALAFLLGYGWIYLRARKAGENPDVFLESAIWFIIAGIGGARLFYFFWYPDLFWADPVTALFSQGGLVWYGGMIGVTLAAILFTRIRKISFWRFADIMAPPAALGLAIGRIGCLLAGCCFGAPCDVPWAIHYPHDHPTLGAAVHPAPLYESFGMLLAVALMLWLEKRKPFDGLIGWTFFVCVGVIRFIVEYFRGDRLVWDVAWAQALNLSASQVLSLAGILIGVTMILILSRTSRGPQPEKLPA